MASETRAIDELDRRLVDRLRSDGRETNRSLAQALGVNEATVAARLRRLEAARIVHVVALTDMEGFGFEYFAFAMVNVAGRSALEVAQRITAIPEVISVTVATGRFDIIAAVLVRDREELGRLIGETLPKIRGVAAVRCEFAVDVLKFDSEWAALQPTAQSLPPPPALALIPGVIDELDLEIIRALQRDARQSNRTVAAELGVSEGTVRARLRRLEQEQRVRIRAVSDVEAFGLGAAATIGVHVGDGAIKKVGDALVEIEGVAAIVRSLGEFDYILIMLAESRPQLLEIVLERIQGIKGVRATETFEVAATLKHVYTWVRLVEPREARQRLRRLADRGAPAAA
jgi:DNA-binding Lrp family transcriptional regulator